MRRTLKNLEGEESENLKEFKNVLKLSKVQAGSYAYVKAWFLKKYGDVFKSEEAAAEAPAAKPNLKLISNN